MAFFTPLPPYRFSSQSRSSTASRSPVDAPDGTIAEPIVPSSNVTCPSTVGLPLESRTSLAVICLMNIASFLSDCFDFFLGNDYPHFRWSSIIRPDFGESPCPASLRLSRNILDLLLALHQDRPDLLGVEVHGLHVNHSDAAVVESAEVVPQVLQISGARP